jgi:hypothetical protein
MWPPQLLFGSPWPHLISSHLVTKPFTNLFYETEVPYPKTISNVLYYRGKGSFKGVGEIFFNQKNNFKRINSSGSKPFKNTLKIFKGFIKTRRLKVLLKDLLYHKTSLYLGFLKKQGIRNKPTLGGFGKGGATSFTRKKAGGVVKHLSKQISNFLYPLLLQKVFKKNFF